MEEKPEYVFNLGAQYGPLELVDVPDLITSCREQWFNQTLCQVNNCVVRLGIVQRQFHWHQHDKEDEFFFVLQGGARHRSRGSDGQPGTSPGLHRPQRGAAPHQSAGADRHADGRGSVGQALG